VGFHPRLPTDHRFAVHSPSGIKEIPYIQRLPQTRSMKSKECYMHGKAFLLGLIFWYFFIKKKVQNEKSTETKMHYI